MSNFTEVPDIKKSPVLIIGLSFFALLIVGGFVIGLVNNHDYISLVEVVSVVVLIIVVVFIVRSMRKRMSEKTKENIESTFWSLSKGDYFGAGPLWLLISFFIVLLCMVYAHFYWGAQYHCSVSNYYSLGYFCTQ